MAALAQRRFADGSTVALWPAPPVAAHKQPRYNLAIKITNKGAMSRLYRREADARAAFEATVSALAQSKDPAP